MTEKEVSALAADVEQAMEWWKEAGQEPSTGAADYGRTSRILAAMTRRVFPEFFTAPKVDSPAPVEDVFRLKDVRTHTVTFGKPSPAPVVPQVEDVLCTRCGKALTLGVTYVGDGDGSGQRFAHAECYYAKPSPSPPRKEERDVPKPCPAKDSGGWMCELDEGHSNMHATPYTDAAAGPWDNIRALKEPRP